MAKCLSVTWGRLERAKVQCRLDEGHDGEHTDGCLSWKTEPSCSGCGDGTGILVDAENHASNCLVCNSSYEDLVSKVRKLERELSLQKTIASAAGVSALLGHNCPPTTVAEEWEQAARMFRASWEKEKEVSATSHKLGYAAAIIDVVGWLRNDRPCRPENPEDPTARLCIGCDGGRKDDLNDEGRKGCLNDILDEAALKIEAARPGSLGLVETAMADRRDAVQALRSIAAILDGDGGHRQDGDASFAATVERIRLLVCDMREALRYAERAPLVIKTAADIIEEETGEADDEIRDYAVQLAKMLAKVAAKEKV